MCSGQLAPDFFSFQPSVISFQLLVRQLIKSLLRMDILKHIVQNESSFIPQ